MLPFSYSQSLRPEATRLNSVSGVVAAACVKFRKSVRCLAKVYRLFLSWRREAPWAAAPLGRHPTPPPSASEILRASSAPASFGCARATIFFEIFDCSSQQRLAFSSISLFIEVQMQIAHHLAHHSSSSLLVPGTAALS